MSTIGDEDMYSKRKYKNKVIETEDGKFDGKNELLRWLFLKDAESSGVITNLRRQVEFILLPKQTKTELEHLKTKDKIVERFAEHPVKYIADFVYYKNGEMIVEDFKGMKTDTYIIKRKMMLYFYGITIRETRKPSENI